MSRNEVLVIPCTRGKISSAKPVFWSEEEREVLFVARPEGGGQKPGPVWASPEGMKSPQLSWREFILQGNSGGVCPDNLYAASELYKFPSFVVEHIGRLPPSRLFFLSAGWGLVRSDFRLPLYNITFNPLAKEAFRRSPRMDWADFFPAELHSKDIVFLGGVAYAELLEKISRRNGHVGGLVLHAKSSKLPRVKEDDRVRLHEHNTARRTNWHFEFLPKVIGSMLDRKG